MADINEKGVVATTDYADPPQENEKSKAAELAGPYDFAVSKDGIKIHPQPTSDPLDPLNWSAFKKNTILGIVMFKYVYTTYMLLRYQKS